MLHEYTHIHTQIKTHRYTHRHIYTHLDRHAATATSYIPKYNNYNNYSTSQILAYTANMLGLCAASRHLQKYITCDWILENQPNVTQVHALVI